MALAPNLRLVRRPVEFDHEPVDLSLPVRFQADKLRRNRLVDIGDGLQHAFAAVTRFIAIAQFDGLMLAGGSSGRHRGGNGDAVIQAELHPQRWVAAGIEDLKSVNGSDFSHRSIAPSVWLNPASLNHQDIARSMFDEPVRGAADDAVIERGVPHIADHKQAEAFLLNEFGDAGNGMANEYMRVSLIPAA